MAGIFTDGVAEVRPGSYFNVNAGGGSGIVGAQDGITAVVFKAAFGSLNEVRELSSSGEIYEVYGNDGNVDVPELAFTGGAKTVLAVRVGTGGTAAKAQLGETATITAKYPGSRLFSVTVKDSLTEEDTKTVIFYGRNKPIETYSIKKDGSTEGTALMTAMKLSENFTVNVDSYSDAFGKLESTYCNSICVDTEEYAVHLLLKAFLNRAYNDGFFTCAVIAEKPDTALEDRMVHAAVFNDEKMVYVLNAKGMRPERRLEGCRLAAIVAGMYAAYPCNKSLTHKVLNGVTELTEIMKPSEMVEAETRGCLRGEMNPRRI